MITSSSFSDDEWQIHCLLVLLENRCQETLRALFKKHVTLPLISQKNKYILKLDLPTAVEKMSSLLTGFLAEYFTFAASPVTRPNLVINFLWCNNKLTNRAIGYSLSPTLVDMHCHSTIGPLHCEGSERIGWDPPRPQAAGVEKAQTFIHKL